MLLSIEGSDSYIFHSWVDPASTKPLKVRDGCQVKYTSVFRLYRRGVDHPSPFIAEVTYASTPVDVHGLF